MAPEVGRARLRQRRRAPSFFTGLPAEAAEQRRLVGLGRFELPTSRLSSARSNQLSYKPEIQAAAATHTRERHAADGTKTADDISPTWGLVREERET